MKRIYFKQAESKEALINHFILKEIHSHMFADPLKYIDKIKSYTKEGITNAYFGMPVERIHETMIGPKEEDKEKVARYDYMKGRENQAYKAFRQIEALRVLGMNNLEIGRIIAEDKYDAEKGYLKLRDTLRELREKRGISEEKLDEMTEKFRLETVHKALKARNMTKDILKKYI